MTRQERSLTDVVSQEKVRKARVNRGEDITVCLPGAKIDEKAGQVMSGGTGGAVFEHVGMNSAEKGTSAIIGKYSKSVSTLK